MNLDTPSTLIKPARKPRWPWIAGFGALVLLSCLWARGASRNSKVGDGAGARAVPILAAAARTGDLDLSLTGLGTVTSLNAVTVRSRVDGQLMRFAVQEGQMVPKGGLLAEIDPRPFQVQLMQAEGQRAKDEAAFRNARLDLDRYRSLAQQGILPKQQLDAQASTVSQYEAALKADQGQVESAKLNLTYSRITAPVAGRVGLRLVDPGNMVHASDANGLLVIAPVQPITVVFTIPADAIQQVLARQRKGGTIAVEALDRDLRNRLSMGTLEAMDNQVDPATGTLKLKALFQNADGALFPNQFVNARLRVDTLHGVILVPSAALQRSAQDAFVYVVKADSTVDMRTVEVLATEGDLTALRKGLSAGETVVTDGLEKLKPGARVALGKAIRQDGRK